MSATRPKPDRFHNARSDYCTCPMCMRVRREEAAKLHAAENEAARFIPTERLYQWIRRTPR